ncbi:MAG TPA: patatin-like phospholipase family protein [Sandaracinaceae bacterium LLY-WYZ-13_1]|nr:patatin-like phospholipase family protein [Sandaracinaceae bacterium LLY-WYZ-13_1]
MDTIVYFGPRFAELQIEDARRAEDGSIHLRTTDPVPRPRRVVGLEDLARAVSYLRHRPVDALIVDARTPRARDDAHRLLEVLFPHGRMGGPVAKRRVLALVGGGSGGAAAAFAFGGHGIGDVLVEPTGRAIHARVDALLAARGHGKVAICLAGGGIEGLLYELGVLRALEAFLADRSVVDVDFFCGISAGAILGALLANGVGPGEILRALEGESRRVDAIDRWDLFEPNVGEMGWRLWRLLGELVRGGQGPRGALSSLTRAVPSAAFSGRRLGRWLERQLGRPGMSDRFDGLRRPLYVGATDQDTSRAVLFGDEAHRDVPVHRAVHASTALVPFYPPVEVKGRRYVDGAFSRTTNMRVAAERGATLVILIDPLVPVRAAEPGYVFARGGIFGTAQGLKALINGRFDKAVHAIAEMHPDVAFHLFRPKGEQMRILSGSPMKYFYRREIADLAYESTLDEIRGALPQLSRDFALHGVELRDPAPAPRRLRARPPSLSPHAIGV